MPVSAPPIQWPSQLNEQGPAQDPSVMLTGRAEIAGVAFKVTALRMRDGMRIPDYRDDISEAAYEDAIDCAFEDVEDLVGSLDPRLISLNGAQYLLWLVPLARD